MKNPVETFVDSLENELKRVKSSYEHMIKTKIRKNTYQSFGFGYRMKNNDLVSFGFHYIGDFHIKHRFHITCVITSKGETFDHEEPEFKKYYMEHVIEIENCYQHFLSCFQKTMEQHSQFRLYVLTHSDMIINDVEGILTHHKKDLPIPTKKKNIRTKFKAWVQKLNRR